MLKSNNHRHTYSNDSIFQTNTSIYSRNGSLHSLYQFQQPQKMYHQKLLSNNSDTHPLQTNSIPNTIYSKNKKPQSYQNKSNQNYLPLGFNKIQNQAFQNRKSLNAFREKVDDATQFNQLKRLLKESCQKSTSVMNSFKHLDEKINKSYNSKQRQQQNYFTKKSQNGNNNLYNNKIQKPNPQSRNKQQNNNSMTMMNQPNHNNNINKIHYQNNIQSKNLKSKLNFTQENQSIQPYFNFKEAQSVLISKNSSDKGLQCTTHQFRHLKQNKSFQLNQVLFKSCTSQQENQITSTPLRNKCQNNGKSNSKLKSFKKRLVDNLHDLRTTQTKYLHQQEYNERFEQSMIIYQGSQTQKLSSLNNNSIILSQTIIPHDIQNNFRCNTISQQNNSGQQSYVSLTKNNKKLIFEFIKQSDQFTLLTRQKHSHLLMTIRLNCSSKSCLNFSFQDKVKQYYHDITNYQFEHINPTSFNKPICIFEAHQSTVIQLIHKKRITLKNVKPIYDTLVTMLEEKYYREKQELYKGNIYENVVNKKKYQLIDLFCCCSGGNYKMFNTRSIINRSIEQNCGILMFELCQLIRQKTLNN